ncbi:phosphoribosylamine--glycine ligase [Candidatus Lokiarchaeum ossiferum]|uniref:phosphoribosylamine--glycine ligase n=1 Tax=Candidatus Lokiarchaeum ossiferum TaxID=2951803 RepID=UPI00352D6BE5
MVKVLLIGNGAREHVMAEALIKGGATICAFMSKKNPAIARLCNDEIIIDNLSNFSAMIDYAKLNKVDFAIVGPEAPLVIGVANALQAQDIPTVGPTIECAQLEGSKIFMRSLLEKYKIESNIMFKQFKDMDEIKDFVHKIGKENVVVKPDGLTGGKGVKVWGDHLHSEEDIYTYCNEIFDENGRVIIEEKLDGEEFTYICFVDGKNVVGTPLVQDNKRAYNGDEGPNTGGMGSYSMGDNLLPFVSKEDVSYANDQMHKVVAAIAEETKQEYKGILYGQFMKTRKGLKIVEFNIRFGDPEAMNILTIMKSNFVTVCQDILAGTLLKPLEFEQKATVCKYLVPEGYPVNPVSHSEIIVDKEALEKIGAKLYYASVSEENGKVYSSTSRAIGIIGIANTLSEAEKIAEEGTKFVSGALFHRTDIGTQEVLDKRIQHMENVLKE